LRSREGIQTAISPELVLVDPDLAHVKSANDRTHGDANATSSAGVTLAENSTAPTANGLELVASRQFLRVLLGALLLLVLLGFGVTVGVSVGDPRAAAAAQIPTGSGRIVPIRSSPDPQLAVGRISRVPPVGREALTVDVRREEADIERRVLELVQQTPSANVPNGLLDARNGMLRNNLQIVCRKQVRGSGFICVARVAGEALASRITIRYQTATHRVTRPPVWNLIDSR
jgi:hypothetical protein